MDKASLEVMAQIQGEDLDNIIDDLTAYTPDELATKLETHLETVHGAAHCTLAGNV
ncbi:MAG: hypothetical protein ABEJ40_06260 [Haloarculaceae archaeon]